MFPMAGGEGSDASLSYRDAGVDIDAGDRAVDLIKAKVRSTFGPQVLAGIGGFGSLFAFGGYREPVLVASADGVGTKLKIAFAMDRHDTIGVDLVNHCVNDILTCGATPLFFLDYIGMGKLMPDRVDQIVSGLADGCRAAGCALVGGETAEMPGIYAPDEYDLAGFIVGAVERDRIVDGSRIQAGDDLWGIPSSGLHTNGYSLARAVFKGEPLARVFPELGRTLGEELLEPHRCYLQPVGRLLGMRSAESGVRSAEDEVRSAEDEVRSAEDDSTHSAPRTPHHAPRTTHPAPRTPHHAPRTQHPVDVRGLAHITGGGIPGNVSRIIPAGRKALFHWGSWPVPPIFSLIQQRGRVPQAEMLRVFNLGLGYVVICPPEDRERVRALVPEVMLVGEIVPAEGGERVEVAGE